jgi:hypothetical protein
MSAWKLAFVGDDLVSCGDFGHIEFYSLNDRKISKKLEGG